MIRLIQRHLIIPRGDTGTFSVPVLSSYNNGDVAVFSILDPKTHKKIYEKMVEITESVITIRFEHGDTVNLPVGKYLWDIKFYQNPIIVDGELINGTEINSYYAAFSLPECEIRQTGDNLMMADNAPGATLTPQQLNLIGAALSALHEAVEKTETNVTHYPTIINGEWNIWDANLNDYTSTGVAATDNTIASIEKINTEGLIDTYNINFTNGTYFTYTITNGAKGDKGDTGATGAVGPQGPKGDPGEDYVLTSTDKLEIADLVREMYVVTVSGTDPVIEAEENTRYVCGEVATLSFTPSATGTCDVIFTSGSTPTVVTLPSDAKMPEWYAIAANRTYEINISEGIYGVVTSWT